MRCFQKNVNSFTQIIVLCCQSLYDWQKKCTADNVLHLKGKIKYTRTLNHQDSRLFWSLWMYCASELYSKWTVPWWSGWNSSHAHCKEIRRTFSFAYTSVSVRSAVSYFPLNWTATLTALLTYLSTKDRKVYEYS